MAWTYFDAATLGNDAKPIDSATMTDIVRGNLEQLKSQAPAAWCFPLTNGAPTTTSATYNTTTTVMIWFGPVFIRASSQSRQTGRSLNIHTFAKVSSGAQTGTVRWWIARNFQVPSATPEVQFLTAETGGITSTTGEWKTVTLAPGTPQFYDSLHGELSSEPMTPYCELYIGCQGKVTGGATLTLINAFALETG